jgi:hypothetical protein
LEREFGKKRKELMGEIEDREREAEELKGQLKEQKARMEVVGINFKFEEAAKLKKYIEENELLHQREIEKLDSSYAQVIANYETENRRIKNEKIHLENALVEWLGNHHKLEQPEQGDKGDCQFTSDLLKLSAVEFSMGQMTGQQLGSEFVQLLHNYSRL